jgi:VanZ family protein
MILSYLAIFYFSSISYIPIPQTVSHMDKLLHFIAFFMLTIFTLRTFFYRKLNHFKHKLYVFLIVIVYAMTDEIHQLFVPNRFFDYWDWTADLLGAVTAIVLFNRILKFEQKLFAAVNIKLQE